MLDQLALVNEKDHLFKFAMRLCKNKADADDLLQATLLRAIEKKALFEDGSDVFKWTSKIMFNTFVSGRRRKMKFEAQYTPEDYVNEAAHEASSETKMELREVREAMHKLSDEHRDMLVMVCVQGMRYHEVAEALGLPIGTVRSRLSRARQQLQELMGMNADEEIKGIKKVPTYLLAA